MNCKPILALCRNGAQLMAGVIVALAWVPVLLVGVPMLVLLTIILGPKRMLIRKPFATNSGRGI
jgi:hypothetical protein